MNPEMGLVSPYPVGLGSLFYSLVNFTTQGYFGSDIVQRAADGFGPLVEDMSVDHGSLDIFVPQQFLDGADVVAVL